MKYLLLLPLVFAASCGTRPQLVIRPLSPPAVEPVSSVRYGEVVRPYYVGRFVDPSHPETMHEQHPVYRIESSAQWNLHPDAGTVPNLLNPPPNAAYQSPLTNDVLVAEMNRQREITARVMQEAGRLAQSYGELHQMLGEMKNVARNNVTINARITEAERRIGDFQKELEKLPAATAATNTSTESLAKP